MQPARVYFKNACNNPTARVVYKNPTNQPGYHASRLYYKNPLNAPAGPAAAPSATAQMAAGVVAASTLQVQVAVAMVAGLVGAAALAFMPSGRRASPAAAATDSAGEDRTCLIRVYACAYLCPVTA